MCLEDLQLKLYAEEYSKTVENIQNCTQSGYSCEV